MVVKDFLGQGLLKKIKPGSIPVAVQVGVNVGPRPKPLLLLIPKPGRFGTSSRGMYPTMIHMVEPAVVGIVKYTKPFGVLPSAGFQFNRRAKNIG